MFEFVIFADDTNVFCSDKNLKGLSNGVEREVEILKLWFDMNKLSLNVKKTTFFGLWKSKRN